MASAVCAQPSVSCHKCGRLFLADLQIPASCLGGVSAWADSDQLKEAELEHGPVWSSCARVVVPLSIVSDRAPPPVDAPLVPADVQAVLTGLSTPLFSALSVFAAALGFTALCAGSLCTIVLSTIVL